MPHESYCVVHVDCSVRVPDLPDDVERAKSIIDRVERYARRLGAATFSEETHGEPE